MSNKRKSSSQQSIDTFVIIKNSLIKKLLGQLESFEQCKNKYLLKKLIELLDFKNKRIKNQTSESDEDEDLEISKHQIDLEISTHQIKKIFDLLLKLDRYYHLKKTQFNDLLSELDKIKEPIMRDLVMLSANIEFKIDNEDNLTNNENNYFHNLNYNLNYDDFSNDESNCNGPINEPDDDILSKPINESANNDTINQTINKSTINEKTINELNDKVIENLFALIFQHLSIKDLLNCRLVNKQFKKLSDNTNGINKLIIGEPLLDYFWCYNNKLIENKDKISLKCFGSIKLLSIFNLNKNLKYLKICDDRLKLKEISNFINLEILEFDIDCYYKNQQIINLNNLKVFVSYDQNFKLNTPKLEKIKFKYMNKIELKSNPKSIKHLITHNYDSKLKIFKNLEIIELRNVNKEDIDENLLIIFDNLKKLKIDLISTLNYTNKRIKNCLIKILNDKIKLERKIDIYLEGVKIKNIDKFNKIIEDKYWKFILTNYDLLDFDLSFMDYLDYKELEKCVDNIKNDLPISFFDRFQNIYDVEVFSTNNIDNLSWFLNNLKYLTKLEIHHSASEILDNVFYYNLPNTIQYLTIRNKSDLLDINFNFILKLPQLIEFDTSVKKDLFNLAFTSFFELKYLKKFSFYFNEEEIDIDKEYNVFYLNNGKNKLDYKTLLKKCDTIRSRYYSSL